jgi:hypothetical protein
MNLQNDHPSYSMTQGGKEMMEGRWQSMLGRAAVIDVRDQAFKGFLATSVIR